MVRREIILLGLLGFCTPALGDSAAMDRFNREYPGAAKRLQERFGSVKGSCRIWKVYPKPLKAETPRQATFEIDHGYEKVTFPISLPDPGDQSLIGRYVFCVGKTSLFKILRIPGAKDYLVRDVGLSLSKRAEYIDCFGRFIKEHYSILGKPITDVMVDPSYRLIDAKAVIKDRRSLIQVDYELGNRTIKHLVSVVFDPSDGWIIRSSDYRFEGHPRRYKTEIEYGPPQDGFPMPLRVNTQDASGIPYICEFAGWSFEPTPEAEFLMPFYSLPDLVSPSRNTLYYWLAGSAVFVLFVAIVLRRYASRGPTPKPA